MKRWLTSPAPPLSLTVVAFALLTSAWGENRYLRLGAGVALIASSILTGIRLVAQEARHLREYRRESQGEMET